MEDHKGRQDLRQSPPNFPSHPSTPRRLKVLSVHVFALGYIWLIFRLVRLIPRMVFRGSHIKIDFFKPIHNVSQ